jgi:DNA polymerase-3 subunit epsilon
VDFVAIDVETANPDMGSICQIGVARFAAGELVHEWVTLVDPEDYFHDMNVSVHGIEHRTVRGQPKLPEIAATIRARLDGAVCVSHTPFDRTALMRAFIKHNLPPLTLSWLDSAAVVRRTWSDLSKKGYGLKNVCTRIGYEFKHHDALEDAKAAGFVLLAAIRESRLGLDDWRLRVTQPIDPTGPSSGAALRREGSPEGSLHGEVIVFTGTLQMPRSAAADVAAKAGCEVADSVTKKTTLLVVGDIDVRVLAGHEKTSKHRKAEQLAIEGQPIRIIRESDFNALVQAV